MNLQYITASRTDKGMKRPQNEDSIGQIASPNGMIFTVCDGMGGHVAGQVASKIAVESILQYLTANKYDDIQAGMNDAIIFANNQIFAKVEEQPEYKGMGTTVTLIVVQDEDVQIAHVGDSRIYIYNDKLLHRITKDHSFVQHLVDKEIITEEQAETDSRKNQITKALGIDKALEPTISEAPAKPQKGDIFLLCSDGLTDMVDELNIALTLGDNELSLDQKAEKLLNMANNAGGKDNITIQLVEITESPYEQSSFVSFSSERLISKQKAVILAEKNVSDNQTLVDFNDNPEKNQDLKKNEIITVDPKQVVKSTYKTIILSAVALFAVFVIVFIFLLLKPDKNNLIVALDNKEIDTIELKSKDFQKEFNEYFNNQTKEGLYSGFITDKKFNIIDTLMDIRKIDSNKIKYKSIIIIEEKEWPTQCFSSQEQAFDYFDIILNKRTSYNVVVKDVSNDSIVKEYIKTTKPVDNKNTTNKNSNDTTLTIIGDYGKFYLVENSSKLRTLKDKKTNKLISAGFFSEIKNFSGIYAQAKKDNYWMFIDTNGIIMKGTDTAKFSALKDFKEGFAAVQKNNFWGVIKNDGSYIVQPQYDDVHNFSDGMAAVKKGSWGFIDNQGKLVITCKYYSIKDFSGGKAEVRDNDSDSTYFIDKTGKKID